MLQDVKSVAKLYSALAKIGHTKEFNATLPISIRVLERLDPLKYMLKIGNRVMETKSRSELEVGGKYWAFMSNSKAGAVVISNLQKQPKLLDIQKPPLKFTKELLVEFFVETKKPFESYKAFLLDRLAFAMTKDEFTFYSNMLFSLHQEVLSFPLNLNNKDSFLQIKKRKKSNNELEFYAAFQNLGAIRGIVFRDDSALRLLLYTPFINTKRVLEDEIFSLKSFEEIDITLQKSVEPLFEFSSALLDLKG